MNIINADPQYYIYTTLIILTLSLSSIVLVIKSISGDELPITSMNIFIIYFLLGLIGFILRGVSYISDIPPNLIAGIIIYLICSFLLFIAVAECLRNKRFTVIIGVAHIVIIISCVLLSNHYEQIAFISIYALILYSFISFISFKRAYKNKNIGNVIIGFASASVSISSMIQLYLLFVLQNVNITYYLISTVSAVGFLLVGIGFLSSILISEHKQLTDIALRDPLTGLLNRRGMYHSLNISISSANRHERCISAIAIDIDYFKKVNDTYGHDAGDKVIIEVANILKQNARTSDACCRLGGEEFMLFLTDTKAEGAIVVAERVRKAIEDSTINFGTQDIKVTSSFGVSERCKEVDIDYLLTSTDKALYAAKESGRNRVCLSQE